MLPEPPRKPGPHAWTGLGQAHDPHEMLQELVGVAARVQSYQWSRPVQDSVQPQALFLWAVIGESSGLPEGPGIGSIL